MDVYNLVMRDHQVKGDSRLNKVQVGAGNSTQDQGDYLEPPVRAGPRRSSISESAYRQVQDTIIIYFIIIL